MQNHKSNGANGAADQYALSAWLRSLYRQAPQAFSAIFGFSVAINILLLVMPLYMLQIYDRVLTSGSTDTLVWLTAIAVFLLGVYAFAETARRRISSLIAEAINERLSASIFRRFAQSPDAGHLTRDAASLARARGVFQNHGLLPFFDLPFAPLFLALLFIIHPTLGALGLIGAGAVFFIAVIAEVSTRETNGKAANRTARANEFAEDLNRQRAAMVSMGFADAAYEKWSALKKEARALNLEAGARDGLLSASARSLRQILQLLVLGVGAGLAIHQEVSPGAIVAASIILTRALAPIDQIVGAWRSIAQAKSAWRLLGDIVDHDNDDDDDAGYTPLPRPRAHVSFERCAIAPPGKSAALIRPFSLSIDAGKLICLVGDNGSGKTSLLRTIGGVWPCRSGEIKLGGRSVTDWAHEDRGQYVGYAPQFADLLPGAVSENIARFRGASPESVFSAAAQACAHEMILSLDNGYETIVGGVGGQAIASGQRQLINLARAFFGDPVLMLLDEPTANLDDGVAAAVVEALSRKAKEGAVVIAATHDPRLIEKSDSVLTIRQGAMLVAESSKYLESQRTPVGDRAKAIHVVGGVK